MGSEDGRQVAIVFQVGPILRSKCKLRSIKAEFGLETEV